MLFLKMMLMGRGCVGDGTRDHIARITPEGVGPLGMRGLIRAPWSSVRREGETDFRTAPLDPAEAKECQGLGDCI